MAEKLRVLFVGNSYTYYNQMPQNAFTELAQEAGCEVDVTAITQGGYYLCQFGDPQDPEGKRLRAAVAGRHFDCAVIQEQSMNPIRDEVKFMAGVEAVKALISADKFVLYATWGRNDGSPDLAELGITREEMTQKLNAAYHRAGDRFGMAVAEVGKAFLAYPDKDKLYNPDMTHPSPQGSAIAAQVILRQVLGE